MSIRHFKTCSHLFSIAAWESNPPQIVTSLSDTETYNDRWGYNMLLEKNPTLNVTQGRGSNNYNGDQYHNIECLTFLHEPNISCILLKSYDPLIT